MTDRGKATQLVERPGAGESDRPRPAAARNATATPTRPTAHAWLDPLDQATVTACWLSIIGVALQSLHVSDRTHTLGIVMAWLSWTLLLVNIAVALHVSARRLTSARHHAFDIAVIVVACPLWPTLLHDLMLWQLSPALTLLEATKLLKLTKVSRIMLHRPRTRRRCRAHTALTVCMAVVSALLVLA